MKHESDGDTNYKRCTWNNPQRTGKWTGRVKNKRTSGDLPTKVLLRLARMLRRVLEILEETCYLLDSCENLSEEIIRDRISSICYLVTEIKQVIF